MGGSGQWERKSDLSHTVSWFFPLYAVRAICSHSQHAIVAQTPKEDLLKYNNLPIQTETIAIKFPTALKKSVSPHMPEWLES